MTYKMHASNLGCRKSKRLQAKGNIGYASRISSLLDPVLWHIISYLPTENVVVISLVSWRWKHVWTSLQNFAFNDRTCLRPPASTIVPMPGFVDYVDTALSRTHSGNVAKLVVHCSRPTNLSRFNYWLFSALVPMFERFDWIFGSITTFSCMNQFTVRWLWKYYNLSQILTSMYLLMELVFQVWRSWVCTYNTLKAIWWRNSFVGALRWKSCP